MTDYIAMLVRNVRGRRLLKDVGLQEHYLMPCGVARIAYRMKVAGIFKQVNQNRDFTTSFRLSDVGIEVFNEVYPNETLP